MPTATRGRHPRRGDQHPAEQRDVASARRLRRRALDPRRLPRANGRGHVGGHRRRRRVLPRLLARGRRARRGHPSPFARTTSRTSPRRRLGLGGHPGRRLRDEGRRGDHLVASRGRARQRKCSRWPGSATRCGAWPAPRLARRETGAWTGAEEGLPETSSLAGRAGRLSCSGPAGVYARTPASRGRCGESAPPPAPRSRSPTRASWREPRGPVAVDRDGVDARHSRSGGNLRQGIAMDGSGYGSPREGRRVAASTARRGGPPRLPGASVDTTFQTRPLLVAFRRLEPEQVDRELGQLDRALHDSGAPLAFTHHYGPEKGDFDEFNTFGWASAEDPSGNVWMGLDSDIAGCRRRPRGCPGSRRTASKQRRIRRTG